MKPELESLSILIYPTEVQKELISPTWNQRARRVPEGRLGESFPPADISAISIRRVTIPAISAIFHNLGIVQLWETRKKGTRRSLNPTEQILYNLTTARSLKGLELEEKHRLCHKIPEPLYLGPFPYILISTIVFGRGSNKVF